MPNRLSAHLIASRIRELKISPEQAVEGAFARLEELNPILNAFVSLRFDEAMAEAA